MEPVEPQATEATDSLGFMILEACLSRKARLLFCGTCLGQDGKLAANRV